MKLTTGSNKVSIASTGTVTKTDTTWVVGNLEKYITSGATTAGAAGSAAQRHRRLRTAIVWRHFAGTIADLGKPRRHVFGGDPHMTRAKGAVQRAQHHIAGLDVAHLGAPTLVLHDIGRPAHAFGPTGKPEIGIAQHQALHNGNDRLRAGPAQAVHVHCWGGFGHAGLHCGDAGQIHIARIGVDHMAEHDRSDLPAFDPGTVQRGFGDHGPQIDRRGSGEAAAKGANRGAGTGQNNDIGHGFLLGWGHPSAKPDNKKQDVSSRPQRFSLVAGK